MVALALILVVTIGSAIAWWQLRTADTRAVASPSEPGTLAALDDSLAHPPVGTRIRVRVVNVSGVNGLARRATMALRAFGYDVVDFSSGTADEAAPTRIVAHTGHPEWSARVRRAMQVGVLESDRDSSRHVDITVYVGRDWRTTAEPLRP
jgi:hypothetical protein